MSGTRKLPNVLFPVAATVLALLDLGICLMAMANSSTSVGNFIWSAMLFSAIAVLQWVNYFWLYVDFRIEKAKQEILSLLKAEQDSKLAPQD